jgi:hypothetical protein
MNAKMKVLQALMDEMGDMESSKLKPKKMSDEPSIDPLELMKASMDEGKPVGIMKKAIIIKKNPEDEMDQEDEMEDEMEDEDSMEEEDSKPSNLRMMIRKMKGI